MTNLENLSLSFPIRFSVTILALAYKGKQYNIKLVVL